MPDNFELKSIEYIGNGILVVNDSDRGLLVHPKMPEWLIMRYIELTLDSGRKRNKFVLSLTDKCNIRCDYCCHPYQNSEFSDYDAIRLVAQAAKMDFVEICLTGGEPLLKGTLVLEIARICQKAGIMLGVITNGWWAKDYNYARDLATAMIQNGVGRVTFSWDPSHGKYIEPRTISNGIKACMEAGMKVTLTGSFKKKNDCHENYGIDYSEYKQYANFVVCSHNISPTGLALKLNGYYKPDTPENRIKEFRCPCFHRGNDLVLYSQDGLAMPCCSVYSGYDMKALRIGDWRKNSVSELFDNQMSDGYYRVINDRGFIELYRLLKREIPSVFPKLPKLHNMLSACQCCKIIMNLPESQDIRSVCQQYLEKRFFSKIQEKMPQLQSLLKS
ncbi:MAG: radical SAM protein [candidate division Zixibacteria bacterium]|nr:radical SAM protein [candidate division Zixibacteria bacterium]